ncbi:MULTISPECIES: hypothetical protein [Enterobacter]|uniref:hypothetical protein n=1 Tax=Enterobacter TaxID=547 RepID=UPI000E2F0ECA|nr:MULTISPECIES: hypothetical protein [Enterobacter]MCE1395298.1 hypothetical protein [Enterobacter cloacae]
MSENTPKPNDTILMAHDVIIAGLLTTLPEEQSMAVRNFALIKLNQRLEEEKSKAEPNKFIIEMLEQAKTCTVNLFSR